MRGIPSVLTILSVLASAAAGGWTMPRAYDAVRLLAAAEEPAVLADLALEKSFDRAVAEREIEAALATDDGELAQSILQLAAERSVTVDPVLADRVALANSPAASRGRMAKGFAQGFVFGEPTDASSLAGSVVGDLFVFGDVRDALREGTRLARGQESDHLVLALSAAGLAVTAGTYASLGAAAPARMGVSVMKAATRTGRIGAKLASSLKLQKTDGLIRFAADMGQVQSKAGTRAALDGLKHAETPKDAARLARLAEAKGTKTRAVLKLVGRSALALTTALFDLASWIFWAVVNLASLVASLKGGVERMTIRAILRAKAKSAMRARALAGAGAAG